MDSTKRSWTSCCYRLSSLSLTRVIINKWNLNCCTSCYLNVRSPKDGPAPKYSNPPRESSGSPTCSTSCPPCTSGLPRRTGTLSPTTSWLLNKAHSWPDRCSLFSTRQCSKHFSKSVELTTTLVLSYTTSKCKLKSTWPKSDTKHSCSLCSQGSSIETHLSKKWISIETHYLSPHRRKSQTRRMKFAKGIKFKLTVS